MNALPGPLQDANLAFALARSFEKRYMRRRDFIAGLGSATIWPFSARAEQSAMPVVGFLSARSPAEAASVLAAFRQGLAEVGYFEGKNVTIEYRWAEGHYDRLPALAEELLRRGVAVIAATGGEPSPVAAKAATATLPIVFTVGSDPVEMGLVASLSRPDGNLTGTTIMGVELGPKRLDLVRQLVPKALRIAILANPTFPMASAEVREVEDAARQLAMEVSVRNASTESEIDEAFADLAQHRPDALVIGTDPFLLGQRDQLARLAARHAIPTVYFLREFVEAGGLMSYGPDIRRGYRQAGVYTGYILGGKKPAELPVLRPTSFLLSINLKTAKELGIALPATLLALADEVIE
jgi:putative ABC transport system substrate-binding protein